MEDLETSAVLEFHGARYVVTVQVQQQLLHVQVEVAAAGTGTWTGRFPASDVEQLTRQTGNSKRFPVFVQMLLTALHRRSDAVFVDLLTAADLDLYCQRKLQPGTATEGLGAATATSNGKRFLILTYAVEFDRVHYPLPLTPELSPSPEVLQRTIRRLRQALAEQDKGAASEGESQLAQENAALREENRCLKNTLKQYCDGNGVSSTGELQRELEASVEENKELIALYQQFREDSALETAHLRTEIKQLRLESQQSNRSELAKQEHERLETRRKVKDSNAAVQETLAQMVQMKAQLEETQLKNRELLRQLAIARAQAGQQGPRQRSALNGGRGGDLSSRFTRGGSPSARQMRPSGGSTTRQQQQASSAVFPARFQSSSSHYGPSDDEDAGERTPRSARRGRPTASGPAFRRFDPTAYQQDKERKLREARARSNSRTRPPRSNGEYSSDSSVGGYSSAESRGSKASSRSTRSRGSRLSRERQREIDARMSSPKRVIEPPPETRRPRASNNSPLPRSGPPSARSLSRGRSPSPAPSHTSGGGRRTNPRGSAASSPRKPLPSTQQTPPRKANPQNPALQRRKQPPQALLDTSADSFSDIDDRLTALQQFLREAKQGGLGVPGASTAA
ncbi:hypothetical protein PRIC1_010085 [Phytophthora ramorum]